MQQHSNFRVGPGRIDMSARRGGGGYQNHVTSPAREDRWAKNNHASQHYHWIQSAEKEQRLRYQSIEQGIKMGKVTELPVLQE